jgi:Protein of unknown function (DUF3102)
MNGPAQLSLLTNMPLFDYAALDREIEVAARSDAALIRGLMKRTADDLVEIGNALRRQKTNLPHGMFLPWIEAEFAMSERAAQRFMSVAKTYGGKSAKLADLGKSVVYELSAPETPEEVREEIERRVAAGELATVEDVRTLKAQTIEIVKASDQLREQNRDLLANAHKKAAEEAEQRYGALIDDLQKRIAIAEETAFKSIQAANEDAAARPDGDAKVLPFIPKAAADSDDAGDPLITGKGLDDVDLNDLSVGAHVIYGSLSSIDLAKTTPEVFWKLFGTLNGKAGTTKWLLSKLEKLNAIEKGMPK